MANELHTMPLKIERLMSSQRVRALELDEFGAYMKLLSDAWLNGGFLHRQCLRNANALQRLCGCNAEQAERIQKNVIEEFFMEAEDGSLYNPSQVEIYNEVAQQIKTKQDRAAKGAAARWGKGDDAQAMLKQCQPKPKPKPNKDKEKKKQPNLAEEHDKAVQHLQLPETLQDETLQKLLKDFLEQRREKRDYVNHRALTIMMNKFKQHTIDEIKQALEESIMNGYKGVFPKSKKSHDNRGLATGQIHQQENYKVNW